MIARLSGRVVHHDTDAVVIDAGGVGYLVRATASVLRQAAGGADPIVVWVHTSVREDAIQLFGFADRAEQGVFERLIGLQGVGPKVALSVVSAFSPADIRRAAETDDVKLLQSVPGIGPKVARRIVTELAGMLDDIAPAMTTLRAGGEDPHASFMDARDALVGLGMSLQAAEAALKLTDDDAPADARVRQALQGVRA
jgi:Holliday junction DNA helicase RuvA